MSFFSFLNSKTEKETSIIFHIGSSSVSGAIVRMEDGTKPKIIFSAKQSMVFAEKPDSKKIASFMSGALENVSAKLSSEGIPYAVKELKEKIYIHKIYCIFSSPWYASKIKVFDIKDKKPFTFSKHHLKELVKRGEEELRKTISSDMPEADFKYDDIFLMEKTVMHVKLNGYDTSHPFHLPASEAVISLFVSFSPNKIVEIISKTIGKYFHHAKTEFHTFAMVAYSAFKDFGKTGKNFISVDVGGEITDVSIIKDGAITDIASFPIGKNTLTRKIAEEKGSSPEVAASLLRMYSEKQMEKTASAEIDKIVRDFGKEWLAKIDELFSSVAKMAHLPKNSVVISSSDISKIFLGIIKGEKYNKFMPVEDGFDFVSINEETLKPFCDFSAKTISDPFLTAETVYADKIRSAKFG